MFQSVQFTAIGSIDTSGLSMLEEVEKNTNRKGLKVRKEKKKSPSHFHGFSAI